MPDSTRSRRAAPAGGVPALAIVGSVLSLIGSGSSAKGCDCRFAGGSGRYAPAGHGEHDGARLDAVFETRRRAVRFFVAIPFYPVRRPFLAALWSTTCRQPHTLRP